MDANRTDHIRRLTGREVQDDSAPKDLLVTPALVEYLRERFPEMGSPGTPSLDGAIAAICATRERAGQLAVINFLDSLLIKDD